MNKHINKIKLAITTDCNLGCPYCFVKKTKETMDSSTGRRAVDLLMQAEGRDKLLSIYGGEALLNFRLIEELSPYAAAQARRFNKRLTISVCTNATLLTERHLDFFKKYNVKLIISLAGDRDSHDKFRRFCGKGGSYGAVIRRLPLIFKSIPPENIGVAFCVFPSLADKITANFRHLIKAGFRYFNFEIIHGFQPWSLNKIRRFALELNKVMGYVVQSIPKGNFIFLNPINWEIKYRTLTRSLGASCPFNYKLEVYPRGEMAFSPFLLNCAEKNRYIIGNINAPVLDRFNDCRFDPKDNRCGRCEYAYFKDFAYDKGASRTYELWRLLCLEAAGRIRDPAGKAKHFSGYIREIKEKVCF